MRNYEICLKSYLTLRCVQFNMPSKYLGETEAGKRKGFIIELLRIPRSFFSLNNVCFGILSSVLGFSKTGCHPKLLRGTFLESDRKEVKETNQ